MSRTIVDIPDALLAQVDALCKMLSISRAEATRQALKVFVRSHHNVNVDAFGLWAASKPGNQARKTDSKYE
jgi:metal-responsive CopG/Arc/MetJ family transcriptional regulator